MMPLYRVQLVRHIPIVDMPRNPFLASIDVLEPIPCRTVTREWEFEARSEKEVRRLLKEAFDQRLPNVKGFHLGSVEKVKTRPAQDSRK